MKHTQKPVRHIVLVGTSILRNTAAILNTDNDLRNLAWSIAEKIAREYDYTAESITATIQACARATPGEDLECARHASLSSPVFHTLLNILRLDPCRISAEINSMNPWLQACNQEGNISKIDFIDLLHTDTGSGLLAASVLEHFLNEIHGGARIIRIESFGRPGEMMNGVLNLINTIKEIAGSNDNHIVILNVTGGFKPESGAALLTGLAHHRVVAAYYIHEAFKETVILPLIPASKRDLEGLLEEGLIRVKPDSPLALLAYAITPTGSSRDNPPAISINLANIAVSLGRMLGVNHGPG